jgi:CBS domain-containing protein
MLSSICDAVTQRLIDLSFETLGPPPAPFAFIAMGSQGRQEQSLLTDQDNGIIYLLSPDHNPDQISGYFLKLGERVCAGLALAGYNLCRGNVMASNPRWCRSLTDWLSTFDQWIDKSEPQEIVDTSIFFDFRTVYGDFRITNDLRLYINDRLRNESAFFHHLSQNALVFKPPIRLVGNIYIGGGDTDHSGEINLKDAMMPLVSFARLYALRHQINQTHTLGRIETLTDKGLIITSSRDEISESYNYLMQLRLENQVLAIVNGYPPQNTINPGRLGRIQKELLKHAFAQIVAVQKKISYDFLGGV